MKKKSLLLAISAMSIAAIGVGTVGTFAWFAANSASTTPVADTGNAITAQSGVTKSDAFTITAVTNADSYGSLILTNDTGETYMTYDSGTSGSRDNVKVTPSGNAGASVTVTLTIRYVGSATTSAEIESAWDAAVSSVKLTWADTSDNTEVVKDPAAADTDYLKEVTAVNNGTKVADLDRAGADLGTAIPTDVGFPTPTNGTGAETGKKVSQVENLGSTTLIVGINGINGRIQDNWTYSFSVTPVVA